MYRVPLVALLGSLSLTGCAVRVAVAPLAADHPASPQAAEALFVADAATLRQERQDSAWTSMSQSGMQVMEHAGSGMEQTRGQSEGGHEMHHAAQGGQAEAGATGTEGAAAGHGSSPEAKDLYTCPMHPEIAQDKPGNCPKCGMKLVKRTGGRK